ncbi:unnamed protein product [Rotaria magnacalcarata]
MMYSKFSSAQANIGIDYIIDNENDIGNYLILINVVAVSTSSNSATSGTPVMRNDTSRHLLGRKSSLATAIVNIQVLTVFSYQDNQIYVYHALSNENDNAQTPQKWIFYFVPIMLAFQTDNANDEWIFAYSKYWDVVPLMIDSLTAYIVRGTNLPVEGVYPYKALHPNQLTMICRFQCSSAENANDIVKKITDGYYEIEMAFRFAGFKQVSTNMISITSDQLKSVLSKTIADGGNKNAQYIHRNQGTSFLSKYFINVKKMIYMERENANMSSLSSGLNDQFISLLQQGFAFSDQIKLDAKLYEQVWSSSDLNPDTITNEINKLFIYNQTHTENHNYSDNFFNLNEAYVRSSSSSGGGGFFISDLFGISGNGASSSSSSDGKSKTTNAIFSGAEISNRLSQQAIETEWKGQKIIPKSFSVYKLNDITDRLQVAIVAKQLIAESENGAIIRTLNIINKPLSSKSMYSWPLTGEIKLYTGNASSLPKDWLFCHGQALSREEYQRLFSVIGVSFGPGNGQTTFNVPDFRGRFPLGLDSRRNETPGIRHSGASTHTLSINNLPLHAHDKGSFVTTVTGNHGYRVEDPGHNHGGVTGDGPFSKGRYGMIGTGGGGNDNGWHKHTINSGLTGISIVDSGNHTHTIEGYSGTVGSNQPFSIMPPSQTIDFIMFAG